jgi:hypothetical protein
MRTGLPASPRAQPPARVSASAPGSVGEAPGILHPGPGSRAANATQPAPSRPDRPEVEPGRGSEAGREIACPAGRRPLGRPSSRTPDRESTMADSGMERSPARRARRGLARIGKRDRPRPARRMRLRTDPRALACPYQVKHGRSEDGTLSSTGRRNREAPRNMGSFDSPRGWRMAVAPDSGPGQSAASPPPTINPQAPNDLALIY